MADRPRVAARAARPHPARVALAALAVSSLVGCPDPPQPLRRPSEARASAPPAQVSTRSTAIAAVHTPVVAGIELAPEALPVVSQGETFATSGPDGLLVLAAGLVTYPRAAVATPAGDLIVIDKQGWLRRFDDQGRLQVSVRLPRVDRGTPTGVALDRHGRVLIADSHESRVLLYDDGLRLVGAWGERGRASGKLMLVTGIAASSDGRVYLSEEGDDVSRVQVFDETGQHLLTIGGYGTGPGEFRRPMDVALDEPRGRLAVADAVNHRVQLFTLDGEFLSEFGELGEAPGELKHPYDLAFDPQGRLWVADFGNHRLQVFSSEGRPLTTWGSPGREPGQLSYPWGLALGPHGELWLLDSGSDRIYGLTRAAVLAD